MGLGFDGSAMVKAGLTGKNPTDRAKLGVKRYILTDGNGIVLAITLTGANVHDKHGVKDTLNSILIFSGKRRKKPKHLCLDKGYDFKDIEVLIKRRNIQSHIRKSLSLVNIKENLDDGSLKELTVGTIDSGLS